MSNVSYIITARGLTFYVGGQPHAIDRSAVQFAEVVKELKEPYPDTERLIELADASKVIEREVEKAIETVAAEQTPGTVQYLTKGIISVSREGVLYNGVPFEGVLADRMMEILSLGLPLAPWVRFAENVLQNPAEYSRDELLLWLEKSDLPITEDGCFIAYKIVDHDFKDLYSHTFDNSPGQIVQLEGRQAVDPVRSKTCSYGLHFCSKGYLPHYGTGSGSRVVLVKINPADVVSIPSDYDNAKGRTWRYEVIEEIDRDTIENVKWAPVVGYTGKPDYSDDDVDDEYEFVDDEYEEDLDEQQENDWLDSYNEAQAVYTTKGIVELRSVAAAFRNASSQWVWKEASKQALVDYISRQVANRSI